MIGVDGKGMIVGGKPKPESSEEMRLVHHALENSIRRSIVIFMMKGSTTQNAISEEVGPEMLDYHLERLQIAGLIDIRGDLIALTQSGQAYGALVRSQAIKSQLSSTKEP